MLDLKMKRYVIAICSLVLFCGCNKQYEYPQGVDYAAEQIGPGFDLSKWTGITNIVVKANALLVLPEATNQVITLDSDDIELNMPIMYPYFLYNRRNIGNGYEWQVKQDVSGMFRDAGKLRLYGKDATLIVDAPNKVVEKFVIKTLKLKKSNKSSEATR